MIECADRARGWNGLGFNFFQPVMRLVVKETLPAADGRFSRVKQRLNAARSPLNRLCETGTLPIQPQRERPALSERIAPLQLRKEIYRLMEELFSLPNATPGVAEDIFQTL